MARDLCKVDDVAAIVPGYQVGVDGEVDAAVQLLITQESLEFIEGTGREVIAKDAIADRLFDIDLPTWEERELFIGDAADVTGVQLLGHDGTVFQTVTSANWIALERNRETWEPISSLAFPIDVLDRAVLWIGQVAKVTATWGFPAVPETIKRAVARMVIVRYLNDLAAEGTALADAANRSDFNIGAAYAMARDTRARFRDRVVR